MAFGGHFNVMSHIFPQLNQTAAVVVIQILMTDLAYDVALQSSVHLGLRDRARGAQPVRLVLWRVLHQQNGCIFVVRGMLNLWLCSAPL